MRANNDNPFRKAEQAPLFVEDLADAIRHLAHQTGGLKALACQLRPELADEPEKAHRWLLDALNPDRPHELHPAQIIRAGQVGREAGCHVVAAFIAERMGYQPPVPAVPKSARTVLAEKAAEAAAEHARLLRELDRLDEKGAA